MVDLFSVSNLTLEDPLEMKPFGGWERDRCFGVTVSVGTWSLRVGRAGSLSCLCVFSPLVSHPSSGELPGGDAGTTGRSSHILEPMALWVPEERLSVMSSLLLMTNITQMACFQYRYRPVVCGRHA